MSVVHVVSRVKGSHMKNKKRNAHRIADKQKEKIATVMREFKHGQLHSGSETGPKVTDRQQAIAIALSESRKVKKTRKPKKTST